MAKLHSVFFNANYNKGHSDGQYKYVWGVKTLDMDKELQSQILGEDNDAYNFNLTSLNVIGEVNYEKVEKKPNTEKRWIAYSTNQKRLGVLSFDSEQEARAHYIHEVDEPQFIEIEVEV
ncbi:hypothetical protein VP382E491_P0054 [Vibrio phage 382E49-1]|nr:hypothetical protein VP382E491_P0054 [Vibrio phage 382E49-1]